jgi:hypothetical protein
MGELMTAETLNHGQVDDRGVAPHESRDVLKLRDRMDRRSQTIGLFFGLTNCCTFRSAWTKATSSHAKTHTTLAK